MYNPKGNNTIQYKLGSPTFNNSNRKILHTNATQCARVRAWSHITKKYEEWTTKQLKKV